ncbi:MAG TPA: hypothetical protein VMV53_02960 [Acidimicrobiales bacterium]|nr:hypothetical protein [Acidimicrobiales bacterium]
MIHGVIEEFDADTGVGYLRDDGGERFFFHCVAIEDGTRRIDVGAHATGERAVGHLGRDEVVAVRRFA